MRCRRMILGALLLLAALGGVTTPVARAVGAWTSLPPLEEPQTVARLNALPDGRVLVAGTAVVPGRAPRTTAALYDPAAGRWTARTPLPFINGQGFATLPAVATLPDGALLYSGGSTFSRGGFLAATQRYDPATDSWRAAAPLIFARADHAAITLPDGTVLAIGGNTITGPYGPSPTTVTERYDPQADRWTWDSPLHSPRAGHGAVLLRDGSVLIYGGANEPTIDLRVPATGRWIRGASAPLTAIARVVALDGGGALALAPEGAARYDVATDRWSRTAPRRTDATATATVLSDGRVLVTGDGRAEIYDPVNDRWAGEAAPTTAPVAPLAARLGDGRVLLVGSEPRNPPPPGQPATTSPQATAALYTPVATPAACFAETGFCVAGRFLDYWQANGGLARNGYPLTPERIELLEDGKTYTVQYFERVRLEYHPENAAPYDVLLGQFGRAVAPERYALFERDAAPAAPLPGQDYFPETGHNLGGAFRDYWRANGGLPQFGYPLTEEFQGDYGPLGFFRVQCFERACFELHPENAPPYDVLLTQLGRLVLAQVDLLSGPLGRLYTTNAEVRRVLGPPTSPVAQRAGATQAFAGGRMVYFAPPTAEDRGVIRAFCGLRSGPVYSTVDTWAEGQDPGGGPAPEPGRYFPRRGFGKLWRENSAVRNCLGYALMPEERGDPLPFQLFTRGWLLAIPEERAIYAVACTGRPATCTFTVYDDPTP